MPLGSARHKNITGKRSGKLVARKFAYVRDKQAWWHCVCDCGKRKIVRAQVIVWKTTKSCGCALKGKGLKNIRNKRFGRLVALRFHSRDNGTTKWLCRCDCGKKKAVIAHMLGKSINSCGCLAVESHHRNTVNVVGKRFGRLVVLRQTFKNNESTCECRCDCGARRWVRQTSLINHRQKSCGCSAFDKKAKDLTGKRFGILTVEGRGPDSKSGSVRWNCVCDCGRKTLSAAGYLPKIRSCGCLTMSRLDDLKGKRFGRLVVVGRAPDVIYRYRYQDGVRQVQWNCICDCGKHTTVHAGRLTQNKTKSCGCWQADCRILRGIKNKYPTATVKGILKVLTYRKLKKEGKIVLCRKPKLPAVPEA